MSGCTGWWLTREKGKSLICRSINLTFLFPSTLYAMSPQCKRKTELYTCTCGGIQTGRVEPTSPMESTVAISVVNVSWAVSTPKSLAKLSRFESAGESVIHALPICFNPGDAMGTKGIGIWSAEVCWLHRHLLDHFVDQKVFNLLPSPGISNNIQSYWPLLSGIHWAKLCKINRKLE